MAVTYSKGSSGDTLQWKGNLTVDGTQVFTGGTSYAGDVTLGDASSDNAILKGRLVTGTAAGSSVNIDATTSTYPEGVELRYNMADWVDVATFTEANGMYLRMETSEANATGTLQGATIYGVANNVGVQNLKGLLSYAYIKGATAKTVATAYGSHSELTWDAGAAATTITTEMSPLLAKITGGVANDYTKIHGVIVRAGDMDGASRTYGNGILIEDDSSMAGAITWTTGINLSNACTTGVSFAGAMTTAIDMSGAITTGINVAGSAMTTGVSIGLTGKTYTTGVAVGVTGGTLTTGISIAGTVVTGISITSAVTTGITIGVTGTRLSLSAAANRLFAAYATSALTSGNSTTVTVSQTMTGASATNSAESVRAELVSAVETGVYANAIVGQLNYSTAGFTQGLAAVICAELDMASTNVNGGKGTYATYEAEFNLPTGFVANSVPISVMYVNVWGAEAAQFDTTGYLFDINGVTKASGKFFQDNGALASTQAIRVRINGTPYYIMLTSVGA